MKGKVRAKSRKYEKSTTCLGNGELWKEHMVGERKVRKLYRRTGSLAKKSGVRTKRISGHIKEELEWLRFTSRVIVAEEGIRYLPACLRCD